MSDKIMLEDEVKCKYTDFQGTVMSKTIFINGCIQFGVARKYDKTRDIEQAFAEANLDEQNLVIIKKGGRHLPELKKPKTKKKRAVGGAMSINYNSKRLKFR